MILGRFEIGELVGRGGGGAVHRGRDVTTGAAVAIKRITLYQAEARSRVEREARALAELSHPGIVGYVAHGSSDDGTMLLVMPWIEGETLSARLARGPLEPAEAQRIVLALASALAAVHARGLVHRDVKPSNVLLAPSGPVLVDFGIALAEGDPRLTAEGAAIGTPAYMAPEQVRATESIDARADVYGLGALWFHLLVGHAPFVAEGGLAVLAMVLLDDAPRVTTLAANVERATADVIASMLAKDPAARPPSMVALDAAITRGAYQSGTTWARRERRLTTLLFIRGGDSQTIAMTAAHGATLDARLGDVVMAAFVDGPATERALRAVACARALQARHPNASMAIATERKGVTVDLAATAASAGKLLHDPGIRVDDATASLVSAAFVVEDHSIVGERAELAARCVGRERERKTIRLLFDECIAESAVRMAIVSGEAGMGKTTLLSAIALELSHGATTIRVPTSPIAKSVGYGVAAAVTSLDDLSGIDDPRARGDAVRKRLGDALVALAPVVLFIDDLQWADAPSLTALAGAMADHESTPILVLAGTRPEGEAAVTTLGKRGAVELRLAPLSTTASQVLAHALVHGDEGARDIAARSGGSPLSIAELARAHHSGVSDLPTSISAMLEARIARANPSARVVLRAASIIGTTFERAALGALVPDVDVDIEVAVLVGLDFLRRRDGTTFAFEHDLLREAAYAMIDPVDRVVGHRQLGEWLLSQNGMSAASVAHHLREGGEGARAAVAFAAAGRDALRSNDHLVAIVSANEGLGCAATDDVRGELEAILAEAHRWMGVQDAVKEHAARALELLPAGSPARFGALAEGSSAAAAMADRARVASFANELLAAAPATLTSEARSAWVDASLRVLTHLVVVDERTTFDRLHVLVAPFAERDARAITASRLERVRAQLAHKLGDLPGFARHLAAALEGLERAGDRRNGAILRLSAGHAAMQLGAWERAHSHFVRALGAAEELRLDEPSWVIRLNLALVLHRIGRTAEAIALGSEVASHFAALHNNRFEGSARAYLAEILLDAGRAEDARCEAERALAEDGAHAQVTVLAATVLANAERELGRVDRALVAAEHGMAKIDAIIDEGEAALRLAHAEALVSSGRHADARAAIALAAARIDAIAVTLGEDATCFREIPAHARTFTLLAMLETE